MSAGAEKGSGAAAGRAPTPMCDEVWVWLARDREGQLRDAALALLAEAQGLCRRLGAVSVACSDRTPDAAEAARLAPWGLTAVRVLPRPLAPHPFVWNGRGPGPWSPEGRPPRAYLWPADAQGNVLAPLWAAEHGAVLVPGATGVTCDGAGYVVARPMLGDRFEGLVHAAWDAPLAVTLLPGAGGNPRPPENPPASEISLVTAPGGAVAEAAPPRLFPPDPATLHLADAERIVAFGRGAFHGEAVALVERLAALLGAVVAGTRPAADEGWLPFARQIGLTGSVVRPRLYVAVGISGAPYHMVGVKEPETLVAVNTDPSAPIFAAADLGLVGDLYEVLPRLIQALEQGRPPAALAPGHGEGAGP